MVSGEGFDPGLFALVMAAFRSTALAMIALARFGLFVFAIAIPQ